MKTKSLSKSSVLSLMRPKDLLAKLASDSVNNSSFARDGSSGGMIFGAGEPGGSGRLFENREGNASDLAQARIGTKAGDLWTVKREGMDWPVLICDDAMVQAFFEGERPSEPYQPVIFLGDWERRFIATENLDPSNDQEMLNIFEHGVGDDSKFLRAWNETIERDRNPHDKLEYWRSHLSAVIDHGHVEYGISTSHAASITTKKNLGKAPKRQRKFSSKLKHPAKYGYSSESVDDDEGDTFVKRANLSAPSIKQDPDENALNGKSLDDLNDDEDGPVASSISRKRNRIDRSGRSSSPLSNLPFRGGITPKIARPMGDLAARTFVEPTNNTAFDSDKIIVYVGNPHTAFRVSKAGLQNSPLLWRLQAFDEKTGSYIMSPLLSSIDPNNFRPIGEFLERNEYRPTLLSDGQGWEYPKGDLNQEERSQEILRCGIIRSLAKSFEIPKLQDLVFRKLKALVANDRRFAEEVLEITEDFFNDGEPRVRQYLVRYIADAYDDLVPAQSQKLLDLTKDKRDLGRAIQACLTGLDTPDSVESEDKVEERAETEPEAKSKVEIGSSEGKETDVLGYEMQFQRSLGMSNEEMLAMVQEQSMKEHGDRFSDEDEGEI